MFHGEEDAIICKSGSEYFAQSNKDKVTLKVFSNTKHEPHNDLSKETVFAHTLNWLEEMLNSGD